VWPDPDTCIKYSKNKSEIRGKTLEREQNVVAKY
jgi:hypothetical protein